MPYGKEIEDHPALKLPAQPEILKYANVELAGMFRAELPYFLGAKFGLSLSESLVLQAIAPFRQNGILCQAARSKAMPLSSLSSFKVTVSRLRAKLSQRGIELGRGSRANQYLRLAHDSRDPVDQVIEDFRTAIKTICATAGLKSLKITPDSLPNHPRDLRRILRILLGAVYEDPMTLNFVDLNLTPSEKIIIGVFYLAIRQGQNFIPSHRILYALYPPFLDIDTDIKITIKTLVHNLRSKTGAALESSEHKGITRIDDSLREKLLHIHHPTAPNAASPPSRTSSWAISVPGS